MAAATAAASRSRLGRSRRDERTAAVDPGQEICARCGQVEPTPPQSDLFKSQTPTTEFT